MANTSYLLRPDLADLEDPYHTLFYSSSAPVVRSSEFEEHEDSRSSDPESVVIDRHSQAAFVMDLLHDRVERSSFPSPNPRAYRGDDDDDDELGFGIVEDDPDRFDFELGFREFVNGMYNGEVDEEDDGFFIQRTVSGGRGVVGGIGMSDSEIEEEVRVNSEEDDGDNNLGEAEFYGYEEEDDVSVEFPLCWDSLRLGDNEEFGWEEVDARVDERESSLSVFFGEEEYENEGRGGVEDEDEGVSVSFSIAPTIAVDDLVSVESIGGGIVVEGEEEEVGGASGNVEWEVLLNANNFITGLEDHELDHHVMTYFRDHNNDYVYPAEYETLFGQFVENGNVLISGRPPAAKHVVENLRCVVVSREEVDGDNALCAVCKDGFGVGEQVKQLPCSHRYHGECIVPWFGIRNTCPVCRYELPTDDPDYERRQVAATQHGG